MKKLKLRNKGEGKELKLMPTSVIKQKHQVVNGIKETIRWIGIYTYLDRVQTDMLKNGLINNYVLRKLIFPNYYYFISVLNFYIIYVFFRWLLIPGTSLMN